MSKRLFALLVIMMVASMILAACGGGVATAEPAATEAPAEPAATEPVAVTDVATEHAPVTTEEPVQSLFQICSEDTVLIASGSEDGSEPESNCTSWIGGSYQVVLRAYTSNPKLVLELYQNDQLLGYLQKYDVDLGPTSVMHIGLAGELQLTVVSSANQHSIDSISVSKDYQPALPDCVTDQMGRLNELFFPSPVVVIDDYVYLVIIADSDNVILGSVSFGEQKGVQDVFDIQPLPALNQSVTLTSDYGTYNVRQCGGGTLNMKNVEKVE